ncbi:hypothetical protein ONQ66_21475, partial [Salmonella enterica subsp. enterica serovar Montevideo]|nr:hypothetical protein [Salmonella enterica subsp. enterica serovar Montevideo]
MKRPRRFGIISAFIKRLERDAADAFGLTLYELMLRAGDAAFRVARDSYPDTRHWL